jgi:hypothetical protein
LNIDGPSQGEILSNPVEIFGQAFGGEGPITVLVNGTTTSSAGNWRSTLPTLTDGYHVATVTATDAIGRSVTQRRYFRIDLDPVQALTNISLIPSLGQIVEAPLWLNGSPNPGGIKKLVLEFSAPVAPSSFSIENVKVSFTSHLRDMRSGSQNSAEFFSGFVFSADSKTVSLNIVPSEVLVGGTYAFAVNTAGLTLLTSPPRHLGLDTAPETQVLRATVAPRDGIPPVLVSSIPSYAATNVSPHADLRLVFSELLNSFAANVRIDNQLNPEWSRIRLEAIPERGLNGAPFTALRNDLQQVGLLVNTKYEIEMIGQNTLSKTAISTQDQSGEALAGGTVEFTTGTIRINFPTSGQHVERIASSCQGAVCGRWTPVFGVVSSTETSNEVTVELLDPAGNLVFQEEVQPGPALFQEGNGTIKLWLTELPIPSNFDQHSIVATVGTSGDRVTLRDDLRATVVTEHREPCVDPNICGLSLADPQMEEPVRVTRDNPRFAGKLRLEAGELASKGHVDVPGEWRFGYGIDGTGAALVPPSPKLVIAGDVTVTPFLNLISQGEFSSGDLVDWEARGGRLIREKLYAASPRVHHHLLNVGGVSQFTRGTGVLVKLADEVLVVPVVLSLWLFGDDGIPLQQAELKSALELFDFEHGDFLHPGGPFWAGGPNGEAVQDLEIEGTGAGGDEPPDDIWEQCGIQFQVIGAMVFNHVGPPGCNVDLCSFRDEDSTSAEQPENALNLCDNRGIPLYSAKFERYKAQSGVDLTELAPLLQNLQPIQYGLGWKNCGSMSNRAAAKFQYNTVEVDTTPGARIANTTAHELGHILLGADSHCEDTGMTAAECDAAQDLMKDHTPAHYRNIYRCDKARDWAQGFSNRFRIYSEIVRERRPTPQVCCKFPGVAEQLAPAALCGSDELGGEVVADSACMTTENEGTPMFGDGGPGLPVCCISDQHVVGTYPLDQCFRVVPRQMCGCFPQQSCGFPEFNSCPSTYTCRDGCCEQGIQ